MAYTKGAPKPIGSGRKAGTLNIATKAEQACLKAGICPFDLLAAKALEGELAAIIQLCKHVEPPKAAMTVAIDPEANVMVMHVRRYEDKK